MNPSGSWPRSAQIGAVLFVVLAAGLILNLASAVLVPIALAILVAFSLNPLVKRLTRYGVRRAIAVLSVVAVASLLLMLIGFVVSSQIKAFADDLPNHRGNIETKVLALKRWMHGGTVDRLVEMIEGVDVRTEQRVRQESGRGFGLSGTDAERGDAPSDLAAAGPGHEDARDERPVEADTDAPVMPELAQDSLAQDSLAQDSTGIGGTGPAGVPAPTIIQAADKGGFWDFITTSPILTSAAGFLGAVGIVMVLVIFFLLHQGDIRDRLVSVAGRGALATTTKALEDAGGRISRYLFMQFLINAGFGMAVALGLLIIQVPYAVVWGIFAAVLRYIPYIGPWIAALLPITVSIVMSPGWMQPWLVVALFVMLELVSNNVLEPILYGQSVGLSEVAVVLAAIFWAWMWGPVGLVLATPMTVCLVVLGKYVPGLRLFDQLLGQHPPVGEPIRLYQRLLARNDEDAEDVLKEFLGAHSVLDACDQLLLPTAELIHADVKEGVVDVDEADWMRRTLDSLLDEIPGWTPALAAVGGGETPAPLPSDEAMLPLVLGLPLRSADEQVVLDVLREALRELPCHFEVLSEDLLLSERLAQVAERPPVAVCLSSFPPGDILHVRQVCKRLRSQMKETRIFVGRWSAAGRSSRNDQVLAAGADQVVETIADMQRLVRSVVQLHQATRPQQDTAA